jgi:NAD(P)-dependent dehydrogenase (short-subunit alcohol dehydrogenase family)
MFDAVLEQFGRLDILVNNAGVQTWKGLLDLEEREWDRVIQTNLKGCFLCTQRAARGMKDQRYGRIVNIGSGCNKVAFPHLVDYTASKGGIEMFTKVAAAELGRYGITVNCVAPGAIEIERTKQEAGDYAGTWAKLTPVGRIGTPLDVARAVAFFVGDDADFITGQTLWVDGGLFSKPAWPYDV